jgi:hypothetical protein
LKKNTPAAATTATTSNSGTIPKPRRISERNIDFSPGAGSPTLGEDGKIWSANYDTALRRV